MTITGTGLGFRLAVACAACAAQSSVRGTGRCTECGQLLPADLVGQVRADVRSRRQAFKSSLQRLVQRVCVTADQVARLPVRGVCLDAGDYPAQVLVPAVEVLGDLDTVPHLVTQRSWDPLEDGTRAAFDDLVRQIETVRELAQSLLEVLPPLQWRGVHRELVRAAVVLARAHAAVAQLISAPDLDEARHLTGQAERWYAQAARHGTRVGRQLRLIQSLSGTDLDTADGSVDLAAVTWAGTGRSVTSITEGAGLVREALDGVLGIGSLQDHHLLPLLPLVVAAAPSVDQELLIERTNQLRTVLDAADEHGPWIADVALLVERLYSGADRITEEAERLNREQRARLPRRHTMRTMTDAYRELVEGAWRDLGSVVLIAARATRDETGAVYGPGAVEAVKCGEIVDELTRLGPPCAHSIDMLYRNASAHAEVVVTEAGIIATQRAIRDGSVTTRTENLSDDEFGEVFIGLTEMLVALQLALWTWISGHRNPEMADAVAAFPLSRRRRHQTLSLTAGLAGLAGVAFDADADHLTITATPGAAATSQAETGALSVVAAAFGLNPTPQHVTLLLTGRSPVTFHREEFTSALDPSHPCHAPLALGLITAKWHLVGTGTLSAPDEATFVTMPLADLHISCATLALTDQRAALYSLQEAMQRLDAVIPESHRRDDTRILVRQLRVLEEWLLGLAPGGGAPSGSPAAQVLARRAVTSLEEADRVGTLARALRDASQHGH